MTNPAIINSISSNDPTSCNKNDELNSSSNQEQQPSQDSKSMNHTDNETRLEDSETKGQNDTEVSSELNNDSSTFSTAFTISFEDDSNASKRLSIKDSIRKFAPPKPNTIEKPRQPKSERCQDNSLMSIESAPGGLSRHSTRRGCSNSSRSSSRKSNSSRHSNISDSAAFLIDRMLNFKQNDGETVKDEQASKIKHNKSASLQSKKGSQIKRLAHSSDDILDSDIDFCEDKSDNGTYIVGADPESDAARKKIDELFGLVKAAEASVIADSAASRNKSDEHRQSRLTEKKSREKQPEHVNQTGQCRNSSVSRSSSSSRNDNHSTNGQPPRTSSRHSRNSSCDRTPRNHHHGSRPRRSISQSSRQSSNKELSDGDTRSSRSSLHNHDGADGVSQENQLSNQPSMKFNRAFALRRARLGLGEPIRAVIPANQNLNQEAENTNNMSSSHRRHQINTNTYKAANQNSTASGSSKFCRDDGGRFSLRMKTNVLQGRLGSGLQQGLNRSLLPQNSTLLDNYINKVSTGTKLSPIVASNVATLTQRDSQSRNMPKHMTNQSYTPTNSPYQSNDEPEAMSPSSRYKQLLKKGQLQKKDCLTELEHSDNDNQPSINNRFNYEYETNSYSLACEPRACNSAGKQRGSTLQLGALDSLVISAISSLSLKIRHSVCDVLIEHAKKLPVENETRLIVEEILPQLTANSSSSKSPTSIEEIDQSLYFDLAKTLKNLKKVEQMVDVITLISNQLPASSGSYNSNFKSSGHSATGIVRSSDSATNSEINSMADLSPV